MPRDDICHAVTSAITLVNNDENRDYFECVLDIKIVKKNRGSAIIEKLAIRMMRNDMRMIKRD